MGINMIERCVVGEQQMPLQDAAAQRVSSIFRIKERGQERLIRVDGKTEFLAAADALRRYLRGEFSCNPSCFADCFSAYDSISELQFDELVEIRLENNGEVAGAFDIDMDKGEITVLNIFSGWHTFRIQDVSTAAFQAMRSKRITEDERWERFLGSLDGKECIHQL